MTQSHRPVVLCILDGWGNAAAGPANAISQTATPNYDRLLANCPVSELLTSADDVGLPDGQMGNSEVGHQNLGAGRVLLQDLSKIDAAVADGSLASRPALVAFINKLKKSGGACHLLGLLSPGGVHAHQAHMAALAKIITEAGIEVKIHAFLDGRDTPPKSAEEYMSAFEAALSALPGAALATVTGRYYAMDRDQRWDRVARAYNALVDAEGAPGPSAGAAIRAAYAAGESDEFIAPAVIGAYAGMATGDALLMANFRADRAREILTALLDPAFTGFARNRVNDFAAALGMVSYSKALDPLLGVVFPSEPVDNTLGDVVSSAGLRQLRIAETEKYAHVTFFLNGGEERVFPGEERILIPSPKVATYDLQPEMSADLVTDRLVEAIEGGSFDLIVVNYANADMVGHTGILAAAKLAVATIDHCLGRLSAAVEAAGGAMLITADHGNIECLVDPESGDRHTAHTMNSVPAILVNGPAGRALRTGRLADVAPTLLELLALSLPREMTGRSLLRPVQSAAKTGSEERATA